MDPIYRKAIVTGASRGIGEATVRALREQGLAVLAVARDGDRLARLADETGATEASLDITKWQSVRDSLSEAEADILVNNAALPGPGGPVWESRPEAVAEMFRANLDGLINCLRAVVPGMIKRGRGHIVNIGSVAGLYPMAGMPAYGATKAAVHNLSQSLRLDLHGTGIRVSEIAPGRVETGIHAGLVGGDEAKAREVFYEGFRCLQAEDIARAIVYVLSAPAHVDVTHMEIMPTDAVTGGSDFHRRS